MNFAAVVDFSRVFDGDGVAIAASGMLIVFAALVLVTLFISAMPHLLAVVSKVLPEVAERHAAHGRSESLLPDEEVLAAIGFVLHNELRKQMP